MGKWAEIADVRRPAARVAAEILRERTEVVRKLLPLAANHYRDDIEHVHQLRVSCRRAGAALQAFRPLVRSKSKQLRNWLREIRRAAGPARDTDVLLARILAEPKSSVGHEYVVARLKHRRIVVQQALMEVASEDSQRGFATSIDRYSKALTKQEQAEHTPLFDTYARTALRTATDNMLQLAGMQQPTIPQMHQLRIAGKRLRYSIELFHDAFPPTLRDEVYPLVEKVQSRLGKLNDHATAQALFQNWLADMPPDDIAAHLAQRIVVEHQASLAIRSDFLAWWTTKRVAKLQSQLSELLRL